MKKTVSLLLSLLLLLGITGAVAEENPYAVTEAITIEWWHALEDQYAPTIDAILADFHEQNPLITVEPIYVGNYRDVNERLITALAADIMPALTVTQVDFMAGYGESGICEPLQPYIDASGLDISDFGDGFLQMATSKDSDIIALPFLHSTQVLYYNLDMATEEGITLPETWEEMDAFLEAATVFNADGTTARYGILFGGWISWYFETLYFNAGVNVIGEDGASTDVNGEAAVAVTEKIREWIDKGYAAFAYGTDASSGIRQRFWDGQAFCIVNTSSLYETFRSNADFEIGLAWYPEMEFGKDTSMGGCTLIVPAKASDAQKKAGFVLMSYLTGKDVNMKWATATGYLPTRKSVTETQEGKDYIADKPGFAVVFDNLDLIKPSKSDPRYAAVSNIWRDELAKIFVENAPLQETLDQAAVLITEQLED